MCDICIEILDSIFFAFNKFSFLNHLDLRAQRKILIISLIEKSKILTSASQNAIIDL